MPTLVSSSTAGGVRSGAAAEGEAAAVRGDAEPGRGLPRLVTRLQVHPGAGRQPGLPARLLLLGEGEGDHLHHQGHQPGLRGIRGLRQLPSQGKII